MKTNIIKMMEIIEGNRKSDTMQFRSLRRKCDDPKFNFQQIRKSRLAMKIQALISPRNFYP